MSTEYRRGIPSTAHVEAATRLGLLWHRAGFFTGHRTKFAILSDGDVGSDFGENPHDFRVGRIWDHERTYSYRPIRPDGTLVDWEVLDQEVVRVGQQGQPQGFRADLWRRIAPFYAGTGRTSLAGLEAPAGFGDQEIAARWTIYQELKPLYDLVDGAQGEAAMPADVADGLQAPYFRDTSFVVNGRDNSGRVCLHVRDENNHTYSPSTLGFNGVMLNDRLANFAAVLDAVAERRVAERMRGQTQTTVTSAQPQPEPRRFADVRPDRHGWRWWRIVGAPDAGIVGARFEVSREQWSWLAMADGSAPTGNLVGNHPWTHSGVWDARTVIPTDEQGNPVSWEAAGFTAEAMRFAQETVQRAASDVTPARSVGDIIVDPTTGIVRSAHTVRIESPTPPRPGPLPRFTTDELDDVDHSKTTKLDEVPLRRGKLPTVEQIAKYREVRARRTGGAVADALKESRIDCEVAQHVLERWAGGLGDDESRVLIETASRFGAEHKVGTHLPAFAVDSRIRWYTQNNQTLDTSEKPSPAVQRERQEAEERRQRLAELRQRLAAERAAQPQEMAKEGVASRFALIEPDPQADPAASIRAWEARQAAAKARPMATPPRIAKPAAVSRRPAIEVVDAEADGLSRSEAFAALFGRALNGGC